MRLALSNKVPLPAHEAMSRQGLVNRAHLTQTWVPRKGTKRYYPQFRTPAELRTFKLRITANYSNRVCAPAILVRQRLKVCAATQRVQITLDFSRAQTLTSPTFTYLVPT